MELESFVRKFLPAARAAEEKTGIDTLVSLAQCALESAWGDTAPGNEYFGLKATNYTPDQDRQLLPTTEYSRQPHLTAQEVGLFSIDHITPSQSHPGLFVYYGKAWFRKYATPEDAFIDHAQLFFRHDSQGNQPYGQALLYVKRVLIQGDTISNNPDPEKFVDIIAPIYASGPSYAALVKSIMHTIQGEILRLGLQNPVV